MLSLLQEKKYRLILAANFVSLFGSGLNHSGIIWYVLQQTGSESAVALLIGLITIPSLFFLPFTGLLIDRVDRRHLVMALDLTRLVVVGAVAAASASGHLRLWHIYAMGIVLGIAAFIYWPALSALLQELAETKDALPVNALLMGAAQSGWMIAGAAVGLLYGRYGLTGVLALDALSYAASVLLYFHVRRGKHLGYRTGPEGVASFVEELAGGIRYALAYRPVLVISAASALFMAAMMSQNVLSAPLNDKILRSGAAGFGFCNAGWSLGALIGSAAAGTFFRRDGHAMQILWLALGVTGAACLVLPFSGFLAIAVGLFVLMGGGRGFAGVAISTALMHEVPRQIMGRVQNLATFASIALQLVMVFGAGWLAEHVSLAAAFLLVGGAYLVGSALAHGLRHHRPAYPAEPEPVAVAHEEG